jgi:hypothetical protein
MALEQRCAHAPLADLKLFQSSLPSVLGLLLPIQLFLLLPNSPLLPLLRRLCQ